MTRVHEPPIPPRPSSAGERTYGSPIVDVQHAAPWWYRLLAHVWPSRCREIPEAANPTWPDGSPRIVLRQFAIVKRYVYLQQFACAEDPRFMHSHPYTFNVAIGLWGSYVERRIAGASRCRRAPYVYTLDAGHVHHVQAPTAGHTSIFIGLGRAVDGSPGDKRYFGTPTDVTTEAHEHGAQSITRSKLWTLHIQKKVKRI